MRRILWLLALVGCCGLIFAGYSPRAQTQFPPGVLLGRGALDAAVVPSYTGPGDVQPSPIYFQSCTFAVTAAYAAGNGNACDLVDTATGLASCTLKFASNGIQDLSSNLCVGGTVSVTTFCTVTHPAGCSVTKAYDQTGNGHDFVEATLVNMPIFTFNALGTLAMMTSDGTVDRFLANSNLGLGAAIGIFSTLNVAKLNSTAAATGYFGFEISGMALEMTTGPNWRWTSSVQLTSSNTGDTNFHVIQIHSDNVTPTNGSITTDGTTTTGSAGNRTIATNEYASLMHYAGGFEPLNGVMGENGVWSGANTTATVCNNAKSRYGISVTC
jgi:hypothetical protein